MWGGRFERAPEFLFRAINDSLPVDWALAREDIEASIAWARALARAGVLTNAEAERTAAALGEIAALAAALPAPPLESGAEDVHTWVEQRLIERVGELGKKLHTGRSRNDQVATDLRLWSRAAIEARVRQIRDVQRALLSLAEANEALVIPGYTHLQRAQPVLLAHWALAYVEMLERDAERLADARRRGNRCPLGSAALAGTAYDIDREALARDLGFDGPTTNSLDAVADRDFVAELLGTAALCAVHLSRLAEELIIYSTAEFGFVSFADELTSGSSIMPQKKNPDALELIRGKCGRVLGHHVALVVMLKGLPLSYNKDMQEDKAALFDAMSELSLCLRLAARVLETSVWNDEPCRRAAEGSFSNATELADFLVERGVAFRDAHHQVGQLVRGALDRGCGLEHIELREMQRIAPAVDAAVFDRLRVESALERRATVGGTAPARVAEQVRRWRQALGDA